MIGEEQKLAKPPPLTPLISEQAVNTARETEKKRSNLF